MESSLLLTLNEEDCDDEPWHVGLHPAVEVVLVEVLEDDEVGVQEVADDQVGDHVPHPVVREEEELAAGLGEVVDIVA